MFSLRLINLLLVLAVLCCSSCVGSLVEDDDDCAPIVDLREDILTMNPNGPPGSGGECKFAYPGGQNRVEISFYSSLDTDRTFEWELPNGFEDEQGRSLGNKVTTTEPFLDFSVNRSAAQINRVGMRIVNPCSQSNWVYDSLEFLNIDVPTLSTMAPMPEARGATATAVLDGMIYVLYGSNYDNALEYRYENFMYDPNLDTWTTLPSPTGDVIGLARLNKGGVQVGEDVYFIDEFLNVYKHNLRSNHLSQVAEGSRINPGGDIQNQGAKIQHINGEFIVGPVNRGLYTLDIDEGSWSGRESFLFVDNVNLVDHALQANNRIYYFVHGGPVIEYNASFGSFRSADLNVQHVGFSYVLNNRIFVQHSVNGRRFGETQELDLQELTLQDFPVVAGNACTSDLGDGNLYMVSTATIGKDAYLIGGGRVHDVNGRGGYGSSTFVQRISLP